MLADTVRRCGLRRTLATLVACVTLVLMLVRRTGRVGASLRFAHSRHFQSQALAPRGAGLVFLTSVPYTYGQNPWVIEIEDPSTLFFPFVRNGHTADVDVRRLPCFAAVKALLEADACRGIVTHMRSTAELLPALFGSECIARKVTYAPLGVRLPDTYQTHDEPDDAPINLLFTNSWHQMPECFFVRGGLDVLEAFTCSAAATRGSGLTVRSSLPKLSERHYRILESNWVRVIDRFVPAAEMARLQAESHIYLLPAARIHIVSVLQAMSYGQAVVVSDGWGMSECVEHGRTGLIVPGRAGKASWADPAAGMLREDYRPMHTSDPRVVAGLIESVSLLVEQRAVRRRLGSAAREEVATRFTPANWNAGLKAAFDRAGGWLRGRDARRRRHARVRGRPGRVRGGRTRRQRTRVEGAGDRPPTARRRQLPRLAGS
jgi:glycosyltransferase involved in cell wall biosynthesis